MYIALSCMVPIVYDVYNVHVSVLGCDLVSASVHEAFFIV